MVGTTNFPTAVDSHAGGDPFGFAEAVNLLSTTLSGSHSAGTTTLTVGSTSGFPTRGILVIGQRSGFEIVTYTGVTSGSFTGVTRGAGGTSARSHANGRAVSNAPVAANHNDLAAAIVAIETVLGAGISTPNGVMRKIAQASGTGASGVIEFASIPATYRSLLLHVVGRTDAAITAADVRMTFETSPTAGAYNHELLTAVGTTVAAAENIGANSYIEVGSATGTSGPANTPSHFQIHLPEYASTSLFKIALVHGVAITGLSSNGVYLRNYGGVYEATAAIDRIRLTLSSGNWTTTSRATLWGVPA